MQLMLMRHGEASPNLFDDDSRCLSKVGEYQADGIGKYLATLQSKPKKLAVSPLVRTLQTAERIQRYITFDEVDVWPELIHSGSAHVVEKKLGTCLPTDTLFISHMPLLAYLESYLLFGDENKGKPFQTAELSILHAEESYPGSWTLQKRVNP